VEKVMKKLVCLLAVLALTAPVFGTGAITITGSFNNTTKVATIAYTGNDPLGIALVADLGAGGAKFTACAGTDSFFDVFIDYAYSNPPYALGTGNPVANPNAAGVLALPAAKISLCMGHLQGPASTTKVLANLTVGSIPAGGGSILVTADTLRGSAVDAAGAMTISGLPLTINLAGPVCLGDINGDGTRSGADILAINSLINQFGSGKPKSVPSSDPHYTAAGDYNSDGVISGADILALNTLINTSGSGKPKNVPCP